MIWVICVLAQDISLDITVWAYVWIEAYFNTHTEYVLCLIVIGNLIHL